MIKKGLDENTATAYALFSMCLYKNQDYKDVFFKSLKDQGYDAVEDLEDSFSHRINPLIIFEREVKEAEEARKSTEEYHKKVGIK